MFTIVFINKGKDFEESFFEDILEFLVDFDSLDDIFVTFPDDFEFISQLFEFFFFLWFEGGEDDGGAGLLAFDVGQVSDDVDVFVEDVFFEDGLEFSVSVMFEDIFE